MHGNPDLPWYWEGNVQARVVDFLTSDGWTIERVADTAARERGIDVVAVKPERRLAVEVKGFPLTVYARGASMGEPKPTNPNLQARHWLAEAILAAILIEGSHPNVEIGIALPDVPRYRELLGRGEHAMRRLRFGLFFCDERGHVTQHLAPERTDV